MFILVVFLAWYAGKISQFLGSARFGRLRSQFLGKSCGKHSFWEAFSQFLGKSRGKRSFWKSSISVFETASWKTLVLEVFLVSFWEGRVGNDHFGSVHRRAREVPLGGCANVCLIFFGSLCYRGGCKRSETAIARIYVRSLRRPGPLRQRLCDFLMGSLCWGRLQAVGNCDCANLRSLTVLLSGISL